jgi:hypothetical protein
MSAANPNPMEKSMVSVLVVANAGGGVAVAMCENCAVLKDTNSRENSDFTTDINELNVELSQNLQRYVNECCESESDGKIDGFAAGCCKRRGRVAIAMWYSSSAITICSLDRDVFVIVYCSVLHIVSL